MVDVVSGKNRVLRRRWGEQLQPSLRPATALPENAKKDVSAVDGGLSHLPRFFVGIRQNAFAYVGEWKIYLGGEQLAAHGRVARDLSADDCEL